MLQQARRAKSVHPGARTANEPFARAIDGGSAPNGHRVTQPAKQSLALGANVDMVTGRPNRRRSAPIRTLGIPYDHQVIESGGSSPGESRSGGRTARSPTATTRS